MLNFMRLGKPMSCPYIVTSFFGDKRDYNAWGLVGQHEGIDLVPYHLKPTDPPAMALAAYRGWVRGAGYDADYMGHWVMLDHLAQGAAEPFVTRYHHLGGVIPEIGTWIEKGAALGRVSDSGNATGKHLHFMLMVTRRGVLKPIDPRPYLPWQDVQQTKSFERG